MTRLSRRKLPEEMWQPKVSSVDNGIAYLADQAILHELRITDDEWTDLMDIIPDEVWDILILGYDMTFAQKRLFINTYNKYITPNTT